MTRSARIELCEELTRICDNRAACDEQSPRGREIGRGRVVRKAVVAETSESCKEDLGGGGALGTRTGGREDLKDGGRGVRLYRVEDARGRTRKARPVGKVRKKLRFGHDPNVRSVLGEQRAKVEPRRPALEFRETCSGLVLARVARDID